MISQKPIGCESCSLFTKGKGFVPDTVVDNPEYVFIGEAPGKTEVEQSAAFVGRAGHVLRNWLIWAVPTMRLAYERKKITIANTLRCLPPEIQGRAYPRGEEKDQAEACCRQYDNFGTAQTIVLFGESAQLYWFKDELQAEDISDKRLGHEAKGVLGRVGRTYQKDNRTYVFAPHPAWILRSPSLVEHGQRALAIAANTESVVDVEYMDWEHALCELSL